MYEHGPGNGTALLLPIDQGLEHGPIDFFDNPDSIDPDFQCRLALEGGYSGIVFHIGLAEKYDHVKVLDRSNLEFTDSKTLAMIDELIQTIPSHK